MQVGEIFLMEEPIDAMTLQEGIRRATVALKFVPIFMGRHASDPAYVSDTHKEGRGTVAEEEGYPGRGGGLGKRDDHDLSCAASLCHWSFKLMLKLCLGQSMFQAAKCKV